MNGNCWQHCNTHVVEMVCAVEHGSELHGSITIIYDYVHVVYTIDHRRVYH
jgi:hypothetical protein